MAQRRIAIIISVQGAAGAKSKLKSVNDEAQRGTHLQNGLTNSFIRGNLAARAISFAIVKLQKTFRFAYDSMIDFEFAIKKLTAIKLLDVKASKQLENSIRAVAAVSPRTAIEVANTALSIAKLGLSADETSKSLKGIIDLSVVLDEDVNMVGKSMVAIKNTFGKSASEMNSIANKLFTGFANSALDLEKFTTAFSFSGAAAESAGVSFEQLTALMGVLSSRGIKASTIGTQLRSVFLDLSNPTSKASKAIGGMTIQVDGLQAVLQALNEAELQNFEIKDKFTKRSVNVVEILSKEADTVKALTDEIINNNDNLEKSIDIIDETAKVTRDKMISAFQDLAIMASKVANPQMISFFEAVAFALNSINPDVGSAGFLEDPGKLREVVDLMEKILVIQTSAPEATPLVSGPTTKAITDAASRLAFYEQKIKNITGLTMKEFIPANRTLLEVFTDLKARLEPLEDKYDGLIDLTSQFNKIISTGGAKEQISGLEALIVSANDFSGALEEWGAKTEEIQEIDDFIVKLETTVRDLEKAIKDVAELKLEGAIKDRDEVADKVLKLEKSILANQNKQLEVQRKLTRLKLEIAKNTPEFQIIEGQLKALTGGINAMSDALSNNLVNALTGVKDEFVSLGDVVSNVFKAMVADLIATIIKVAIFKAVVGFVTPGGIGALLLQGVTGLKAASGFDGVVRQPTFMQVGEAGPERVTVTPSAKTARNKNEGGMTVIVQGSIIDRDGFMSAVNQAQQGINRRYVNV